VLTQSFSHVKETVVSLKFSSKNYPYLNVSVIDSSNEAL
jgi:hypothetical protein